MPGKRKSFFTRYILKTRSATLVWFRVSANNIFLVLLVTPCQPVGDGKLLQRRVVPERISKYVELASVSVYLIFGSVFCLGVHMLFSVDRLFYWDIFLDPRVCVLGLCLCVFLER